MTSTSTTSALARVAGLTTAAVLAMGATAGADAPFRARGAGQLRDLQPTTTQPTDLGTAQVVATEEGGSTTVTLQVQGLDHAAAGTVLGAHVHTGSCIEGNGAAAGPHYNSSGGAVISDETEVWLDLTVGPNGTASSTATVDFVIPADGAASVVIHALHTDHVTGAAGARWACLPVDF